MGEDLARAGLESRHRLSCRRPGLTPYLDAARLQPRRLRLHDVHRQQRTAARRRRGQGCRRRTDRRRGALGQSQLRRPHPSASAGELYRLAAAGRRVRARRLHGHRSDDRTARQATRPGNDVFLKDLWPTNAEIDAVDRRRPSPERCSASATPTCSPATSAGATMPVPGGERYAWDPKSEYVKRPPYFDGMPTAAGTAAGHHRRARAGACSATR